MNKIRGTNELLVHLVNSKLVLTDPLALDDFSNLFLIKNKQGTVVARLYF